MHLSSSSLLSVPLPERVAGLVQVSLAAGVCCQWRCLLLSERHQTGFHSARPSSSKCLSCLSGVSTHLLSRAGLAFGMKEHRLHVTAT